MQIDNQSQNPSGAQSNIALTVLTDPEDQLQWIESHAGRISFLRVDYFFATVSGDQGGGFTREDAIRNLYLDIRAYAGEQNAAA